MERQRRLRASAEFERARTAGRSWGNRLVVLHALPNHTGTTRCGFAVSGKVGNAVQRNRVKRRLREIVRHALPALARGVDLVVTARPGAAAVSFDELRDAVIGLLRRADLIAGPSAPPAACGASCPATPEEVLPVPPVTPVTPATREALC